MNEFHFNGQLSRAPFEGKVSAALARYMPLESDNDFEVFAQLPSSQAPIFLNFAEHYQILNALVTLANSLWPDDLCILLRLSMPGGMRLPGTLLNDNVLLMQDVSPEVTRLQFKVPSLLVIDDHLLRYQLEQGHNQMQISFYAKQDKGHDGAAFEQLVMSLSDYGIGAV